MHEMHAPRTDAYYRLGACFNVLPFSVRGSGKGIGFPISFPVKTCALSSRQAGLHNEQRRGQQAWAYSSEEVQNVEALKHKLSVVNFDDLPRTKRDVKYLGSLGA